MKKIIHGNGIYEFIVKSETLTIIQDKGLQLTSSFDVIFINKSLIRQVAINEAIECMSINYYIVIILESEFKVVFKGTRVDELVKVYNLLVDLGY